MRCEMVSVLEGLGIEVEVQHHEVATAGQCEIDMKYRSMVAAADQLMWFKYVIKNVAVRNGKTATFMPKPIFGDNGSGMHVHQSLWKGGKPLFAGDKYGGLSEMALFYIGGVLNWHFPGRDDSRCQPYVGGRLGTFFGDTRGRRSMGVIGIPERSACAAGRVDCADHHARAAV